MNELQLAGRGRRLLATLVDALLVPALSLFLVVALGVVEHAEDFADSTWMLHVLLLAVLSYLLLNGWLLLRSGQTLGKRLFGIALVSADDKPLNGWRLIFGRGVFFGLMFLIVYPPLTLFPLLDHLLIFGKGRRCFHDRVAGTIVVRVPARGGAQT